MNAFSQNVCSLQQVTLTIGGHQNPDTANFSCTAATNFIPHKGYAILTTKDAGTPQMVMLKPPMVPKEILLKKIGSEEWVRFDLSKASKTTNGSLVIQADPVRPTPAWYSDRFFPEVLRAGKGYALEAAKSLTQR